MRSNVARSQPAKIEILPVQSSMATTRSRPRAAETGQSTAVHRPDQRFDTLLRSAIADAPILLTVKEISRLIRLVDISIQILAFATTNASALAAKCTVAR